MFTGIVQETGILKQRKKTDNSFQLVINCRDVLKDIKKGDSIAVNGVCLTVVTYTDHSFTADVSPETLQATNLANLQIGSRVNLEQALRVNGFLGGHLVTGHVDGTGRIKKIETNFNARLIEIDIDPEMERFMVDKGSVTVNGISLTIVKVTADTLTLTLIPETWNQTTFKYAKVGDEVNIETDIIGKYLVKMMERDNSKKNSGLDRDFLRENGFI
ncbi:MAG: riboflavin synthase [Halanaerobiales bacterium]|nr:riboflavin synthase [Halanaerobiales bacterium]